MTYLYSTDLKGVVKLLLFWTPFCLWQGFSLVMNFDGEFVNIFCCFHGEFVDMHISLCLLQPWAISRISPGACTTPLHTLCFTNCQSWKKMAKASPDFPPNLICFSGVLNSCAIETFLKVSRKKQFPSIFKEQHNRRRLSNLGFVTNSQWH